MLWIKVRQKSRLEEKGQAMIEFTLGLMVIISFFFFYVKLAAILAVGNYIHYATFMAARAYSSSTNNKDEQLQNAQNVLNAMLVKRWKSLIKPVGGSDIPGATIGEGPWYQENAIYNNWNQGVTFTFKPTTLTFFPSSNSNEKLDFKLTSESWMAREDAIDEIKSKMDQIKTLVNVPNVSVVWDEL